MTLGREILLLCEVFVYNREGQTKFTGTALKCFLLTLNTTIPFNNMNYNCTYSIFGRVNNFVFCMCGLFSSSVKALSNK